LGSKQPHPLKLKGLILGLRRRLRSTALETSPIDLSRVMQVAPINRRSGFEPLPRYACENISSLAKGGSFGRLPDADASVPMAHGPYVDVLRILCGSSADLLRIFCVCPLRKNFVGSKREMSPNRARHKLCPSPFALPSSPRRVTVGMSFVVVRFE